MYVDKMRIWLSENPLIYVSIELKTRFDASGKPIDELLTCSDKLTNYSDELKEHFGVESEREELWKSFDWFEFAKNLSMTKTKKLIEEFRNPIGELMEPMNPKIVESLKSVLNESLKSIDNSLKSIAKQK